MAEFTIKRKKWIRGEIGTLMRHGGCGCVLGHACVQLGLPPKFILDRCDLPSVYISARFPSVIKPLFVVGGRMHQWANDAVDINDRPSLEDAERERLLARLFAKGGHTLTFVD